MNTNVEEIKFEKSNVLESLLISLGDALCQSVDEASTPSELLGINILAIEFSALVSAYSETTDGFREDLGASLVEAIQFKYDFLTKQLYPNEWQHYLADVKQSLSSLDAQKTKS